MLRGIVNCVGIAWPAHVVPEWVAMETVRARVSSLGVGGAEYPAHRGAQPHHERQIVCRSRHVSATGSRPRVKRLPRFLTFAVLLALLVSLAPPAQPARAAGQLLQWNEDGDSFRRFTVGSPITIYNGRATNECDLFFPTVDIYIVPSGSVSDRSELEDVGGTPNTVVGLSTGPFIDETIGFAGFNGLKPGKYAVVYDECQDGRLHLQHPFGVDALFDPAFEVVPGLTDTPGLPAGIEAIKESARNQRLFWVGALAFFSPMDAASELNEYIACITSLQAAKDCAFDSVKDRMEKELVKNGLFDAHDQFKRRGLSPDLRGIAKSLIDDQIKHYNAIAADPPDPDFRRLSPLGAITSTPQQSVNPLTNALTEVGNAVATDAALSEALLRSLERYQGADAANDGDWALLHARAIKRYATLLADHLPATNVALGALSTAATSDGNDYDAIAAGTESIRTRVAQSGFTLEERRLLLEHGFSQKEIDDLRTTIVAESFAGFTEAGLAGSIADLIDGNTATSTTLRAFAAEMDDVIVALEAEDSVYDGFPAAAPGGTLRRCRKRGAHP